MPYEIPTELQCQEKIVFGMAVPQLAWQPLSGMPHLLPFPCRSFLSSSRNLRTFRAYAASKLFP